MVDRTVARKPLRPIVEDCPKITHADLVKLGASTLYERQPLKYGGYRDWCLCPMCKGRCHYLYVYSGDKLGCWKCHGLQWASRANRGGRRPRMAWLETGGGQNPRSLKLADSVAANRATKKNELGKKLRRQLARAVQGLVVEVKAPPQGTKPW